MSIWTIMGLFTVTAVMFFALLSLIILCDKGDRRIYDEDEEDVKVRQKYEQK